MARSAEETVVAAYLCREPALCRMIADDDRVVTRKTFNGTHTGELNGIPPTGNGVSIQYVDIMRVRDGQIVEHRLSMDQLSFMQQLGVRPETE